MTRSAPSAATQAAAVAAIRTSAASKTSRRPKARGLSGAVAKKRAKPTTPSWSKSAPIELKTGAVMDDVIAVVVSAGHAHWQNNVQAAVSGLPEGLHQVRVSLRRLRSALAAFKDFVPAPQRAALNQEAKWLLSQLGPVRDLDVFVQDLAAPLSGRLADDADLVQLMRAARAAQAKAHANAAKALQSPRARRFATRLETWVSGRGWRSGDSEHNGETTPAGDFARRFLNRRLRKMRDKYDHVEKLSVEERHDLRIAVKKLRYAIEFFHDLLPAKRVQRLSGVLRDMQDNLGHLNDIEVAERTVGALVNGAASGLARRQISAGGNAVRAWHKTAANDAAPELHKLWRKLKKASSF